MQNLNLTSQNKILIISFVVLLVLWLILTVKNNSATEESSSEKPKTFYADTLIPKGFVLIPIDLANVEAVAGLIDQFGIVDLYSGTENNSVLVANRVKILRAPLNQNKYAVMVTEASSHELIKIKGPFLAVVQNRFTKDVTRDNTKNATKNEVAKPAQSASYSGLKKAQAAKAQVEIEYYQGGSR